MGIPGLFGQSQEQVVSPATSKSTPYSSLIKVLHLPAGVRQRKQFFSNAKGHALLARVFAVRGLGLLSKHGEMFFLGSPPRRASNRMSWRAFLEGRLAVA